MKLRFVSHVPVGIFWMYSEARELIYINVLIIIESYCQFLNTGTLSVIHGRIMNGLSLYNCVTRMSGSVDHNAFLMQ